MLRTPLYSDALVIGAGPVGAGTAIALADAGQQVILVEAAPQAARRLAGEWLHPAGARLLTRLGVRPDPRWSCPTLGFVVFPHDGSAPVELPYPAGATGLTFVHHELVARMRRRAADHRNITYIEGVRYAGGTPASGVRLAARGERAGRDLHVACNVLVGADGRGSAVRDACGFPTGSERISRMLGVELRGYTPPRDGWGHVFLNAPSPVLLYRVSPEIVRVCIDVPDARNDLADSIPELLAAYRPGLPEEVQRALDDAVANKRWQWTANRFRPRDSFRQGQVALVGDAAGHMHPLTASGIGIGLADGLALAESADLGAWESRRREETYAQELLSNALYQVFARQDDDAARIRSAVYDKWRTDADLRRTTMNLLSGDERRTLVFGTTFSRVAATAIRHVARERDPLWALERLASLAEWAVWPAATAVPAPLRDRLRRRSSAQSPMGGARTRAAEPHAGQAARIPF